MRSPAMAAQTLRKDISIVDSPKMLPLPEFYRDIRHVKVQRQVSTAQKDFVMKFLKPLSDSFGFWLSYDIDDVIGPDDIPMYNAARHAFQAPGLFDNIKEILNAVDFINVPTEEMAKYYNIKFSVPMSKIQIVPNYLPRWWIGAAYDISRIEAKLKENKKKPRLGFICSSTHFDLKNQNGGVDDFTHIIPFIRSTVDKYQWVFVGGIPQQLKDLVQQRKIELHHGVDLLNYPRALMEKKIDAIVAPLKDNIFNRCKSNIKLLEGWSLGIPVIAQDLEPYRPYTDMLFKDVNDLQNQLDNLFKNDKKYLNLVKEHRKIIDYGNKEAPNGWWLEKNMGIHFGMFMIPQKTMSIDLTNPMVTAKLDEVLEKQKQQTAVLPPPKDGVDLTFDRKG
jgi:hypothetical protein